MGSSLLAFLPIAAFIVLAVLVILWVRTFPEDDSEQWRW